MSVDRWLSAAVRDVRARGLDGAVPVLEAFARAMTELRAADWTSEPVRSEPPQDRRQSAHPIVAAGDGRDAPALTSRLLPGDAPYALDILTASARIREGSLTSVALAESCLARIEELNGDLNAFITVTRDDALAAARDADRDLVHGRWRGPLHGIPISLKDLIDQQGVVDHRRLGGARPGAGRRRRPRHRRGAARGRSARRQDQPARVRVRDDERRVGVRAGAPSGRP